MATGRGEFFRSFLEGLERKPAQSAPGGGQPCCGRGETRPGKGQPGGDWWRRQPWAAPSSVSGNDGSFPETRTQEKTADFPKIKSSPPEENLMENPENRTSLIKTCYFFFRLPSEILIKILLYLDASSLFCVSHVSKLFHQLANDDTIWHKIYTSEFTSRSWKPKLAGEAVLKVDLVEAGDRSAGNWKKMYFRTVAGHEVNRWRRELRDISPYTGLPRQTERVLRNLNVSWELTVRDRLGREVTLEPCQATFFKSSVIVRWSGGSFPSYHHISRIQLHGVRKETLKSPRVRMPGWRSLILNLDLKAHPGRFFGKDRLIKMMHLSPGFIVGIWRGQNGVAFIMVSLHFHRLVEKSLLGSPVCPYSEPVDLPPVDNSDPEFGLHGYTLHLVLHNTGTELMSGHFYQLSYHTVEIQRGLVELKVIDRTDLSRHRSLSGNIKLPWKSSGLEGSVKNCCIVTLTLLDESQKPFWCISSPICLRKKTPSLDSDYSGEHFLMGYQNSDGQLKMKLVCLKEQKQFFLIGLTVYVSLVKVNKHFSRAY